MTSRTAASATVLPLRRASEDGGTTGKLPPPLVPCDADLQSFKDMPLNTVSLFSSEFHARSSDAEWRAGVTLWAKAWHQVPAGSLPNDDPTLARLAELGRDVNGWSAVKPGAMHRWILCSDNRFYHPVVASKALAAWIDKLCHKRTGAVGNAKRWGGEASTLVVDRQLTAAMRACKRLQGEFKADDATCAAIDKVAKALAKKGRSSNVLDASRPDGETIAEGSQLILTERSGVKEKERGDAPQTPSPKSNGEPSPAKSERTARRPRASRANSPWPEDFVLTDDMAAYGKQAGFDPVWLFEKFRTKALAKGWEYRSWPAAFRNFATTEQGFTKPGGGINRPGGARRAPDC